MLGISLSDGDPSLRASSKPSRKRRREASPEPALQAAPRERPWQQEQNAPQPCANRECSNMQQASSKYCSAFCGRQVAERRLQVRRLIQQGILIQPI
jgi:hypothetical protein